MGGDRLLMPTNFRFLGVAAGVIAAGLACIGQASSQPAGRSGADQDPSQGRERMGRRFERRGGGDWVDAWTKIRAGGDGKEMAELRGRLNELAKLSDAEILAQLEKWPPYQRMSLGEKGHLLQRIQDAREFRQKVARRKAGALGLEIPAAEQEKFTALFWDSKLEMDRRLFEEMEPKRRQYQQEMDAKILAQFGQYRTASPPPAKP